MNRGLIALAIVTFALGITEFGMMGVLGDVSRSLGISVVKAGHFISAYSLGVAVGAPLLIVLRRLPLKLLLVLLAAVVFIGNGAAALAPGYHTLLIARFVAGLPHGAFFGAGAIVCARMARPGSGAAAVAVMVSGMTLANVAGVPLATFLSNALSWRWAFALVAMCALCGCVALQLWLPEISPLPDTGLKGQFRFLRSPAPWLIYAGVFFGQGSVYCFLSYIDPAMTGSAGFRVADMSWIMMVAGAGMVAGNALSGHLAMRYPAAAVAGTICLLLVPVMTALFWLSTVKAAVVILTFVATAGLFGVGGPLQYLIVGYARGGEMLGGAGIQIAFNVSNSCSAMIGGLALSFASSSHWLVASHRAEALPALVGVPFALIGAAALFVLLKKYPAPSA